MADRDRPAWFGGLADLAVRYLWRARHGQDDDPPSARWAAVVLVAAVVLGVGAAVYAGFRIAGGERSPSDVSLPPLSSQEPVVAVPIPILSAPPTPSPPAVRSTPPTTRPPTSAATTYPPAARTKTPVFKDKVIAATSVITTGQSFSSNRLRLTVTTGGDLVLQDQGRTVWHTGTTTGVKLVMQNDGHLVLYDARNGTVFSSGTAGNPGAVLILRADGNMVISLNGRILFQTGTGDGQ
jgi:hypothetical protein